MTRADTRRRWLSALSGTALSGGALFAAGCASPALPGQRVQRVVVQSSVEEAATAPTPSPAVQTYVSAAPAKPATTLDYMELPLRLAIPRLGVDAPVISVGLTPQMAMDVPQRAEEVGWYEFSARPGLKGNSILAGHLDWNGTPGVFRRLSDLRPGDKLAVRGADGQERPYTVDWNREWPLSSAPVGTIFEALERPAITLITCGGRWNAATQRYDTRVVVRALR
ncbi:MAG TPA: class F sortase [Chloroflexota bacterium]|nr:class F sortase [Chloroflexota bacterium]